MLYRNLALLCVLVIVRINVCAQKNPCNPSGAPYTSLPGDTTLVLKGGTQVTFNRCEFFDLRDCLEFEELFDQKSIEAAGFTTQDKDGNALLTYGMFRIKLNPGCIDHPANNPCFEVPVKVRMPFTVNAFPDGQENVCNQCIRTGVRLYTSDGGDWSDTTTQPYKVIDTLGKKYIEFYINCPGKAYNCDCKLKFAGKIKIKAPRGNRLDKVVVKAGCPGVLLETELKRPKRKARIKIPLPG